MQPAVAEKPVERPAPIASRSQPGDFAGDPARLDPFLDPVSEELRAVVVLDQVGNTEGLHWLREDADDFVRVQS
jgi:hypothetical protein